MLIQKYVVPAILAISLILSSGCLNSPVKPSVVYVCPDSSTAEDPAECRTAKAAEKKAPEKPCDCKCECDKVNEANSSVAAQAQPAANVSPGCSGSEPYVGCLTTQTFHKAGCSHAGRIAEKNKVCFLRSEDALAAGYTPCKSCMG